jgi:hypothetical protein
MGKVKWQTSGSVVDEVEVEDRETFEPYDGPIPPKNTVLRVAVKFARIATGVDAFKSDNNGIRLLLEVDEPKSSPKARYNGCPLFEQLVDTESSAFKIRQFLDAIGATGKDWDNTQATKDENEHWNVTKIGRIKMDGLTLRVQTKREVYQGEEQAKVARFLPIGEEREAQGSGDSDAGDDEPPF